MRRRLLALLPLLAVILALAPRTAGELGGLTGTGEVVAAGAFAYQFTYQGQLRQNGAPYSGACTMRFRIFADPTSNIALFDETIQGVPVSNGLFTATIGTTSSISPTVFPGDPRYLDVTACGQQLSPRQPLTGVPYAFWAPYAGTAEQVSGPFGGDVSGTQGAATVGGLRGKPVSAAAPSPNQILAFDGTTWAPKNLSGLGPHVVAAGIVKADGTRREPVFNNLRVVGAGLGDLGEESALDVTFAGYAPPSSALAYIVKVTPFYNSVINNQLVVNVRSFTPTAIRLTVRDGDGIRLTDTFIETAEMMVEITAITSQP